MNSGSSNQTAMNGWELPAPTSGNTMGGGVPLYNQSHQHAPVASTTHRQPTFQAQTAPPPLSDNPFETRPTQSHQHVIAQPTASNLFSDDSQLVNNMFASLGASFGTSDNDGGGLLNALNSVSLGGAGTIPSSQQNGNNWGNNIPGLTEDLFSQKSRLGDYREGI